jgi:hypothetical protein
MAQREFAQRGFERHYGDASTDRQQHTKDTTAGDHHHTEAKASKAATEAKGQEEKMETRVEMSEETLLQKAAEWVAFTTAKMKTSHDEGDADETKPPPQGESDSAWCCFVCRRKFGSGVALDRHCRLSAMHAWNVRAQAQRDQEHA